MFFCFGCTLKIYYFGNTFGRFSYVEIHGGVNSNVSVYVRANVDSGSDPMANGQIITPFAKSLDLFCYGVGACRTMNINISYSLFVSFFRKSNVNQLSELQCNINLVVKCAVSSECRHIL